MDRKIYLAYSKIRVILFTLFVLAIPTAVTYSFNRLIAALIFKTDIFEAFVRLLQEPLWKGFVFLYVQSLVGIFLYSLYFNMFKVICKEKNFFMMR